MSSDIKQLIPIEERNGSQAVNARHLYMWLGSKRQFADWIKEQIDYCDLIENVDYQSLSQNCEKPQGGRPSVEYALSINAAKEISMMSRTDKGKQARRYFIECERIAKNPVQALTRKQLALMVVQAEEEKERLALENKQQADQLEEQKPKVTFADAIIGSNTYIIIRDLAKLIQQNGYEIGEKRLYQWLRDNKYLTLDNKPMQRYIEQGLFFIAEGTHSENGVMKAHMTTKVTPKGQQYFINKFIHN